MQLLNRIVLLATMALATAGCTNKVAETLTSPDQQISVTVFVTDQQQLMYSVKRAGKPVILPSDLGVQLKAADFTDAVRIESQSAITEVVDEYSMSVGKKSQISYRGHEQNFVISNALQQKLHITFRVSNDGVAFRYLVPDSTLSAKQLLKESTGFHFAATTKAWLQPMSVAQTGWSNTNPSYEEHYQIDVPVGTESSLKQGWVFPALFKSDNNWIALSETAMDGSWHGSHLQSGDEVGQYRLAPPQDAEVFIDAKGNKGALLANSSTELKSPWRIIAIGSLAQLMESTLGTDLAAPAVAMDPKFIQPGHSSWSWAILKDDFTTFDVQKEFIDYAADMQWDYTLVDADWDKKIGYEKLQQLVDYAAQKNIGILVWYNSSGAWNTSPYSPKSQLISKSQRRAEFARLQAMGVKGIKIDFFGGDGQSFMQYYIDILQDAAEHQLLVNFHGATLPRGWQRTYPNLMTMESIKGFEFTTFTQADQDAVAQHVATALFTRNLFDPMDFTPLVFGDIPNIKRVTENSFELAEAVLMLSGIQHVAEIPQGMATAPDYVKEVLRHLPRQWDQVKFIDGFPGNFVVLGRKAGEVWYIAGINAEKGLKTLSLDLSFAGDKQGLLIQSGDTARSFSQQQIDSKTALTVSLRPSAGFVLILK